MIPEVGQRLGPYEVRGWLAGGGMAGVFRAWDDRLQREVAIKLIRDRAAIAEMRERFLREARVVSGLNHPNICTIFDIGEEDGELYLVMELLEGETLQERIAVGPVPLEEIVRYALEVAEALALAHSRGVVHRDIKPANLFLANKPNGGKQLKVLDFGLANQDLGSRDAASGRTQMGVAVGTILYMSPEQARGEELDARSDLFSLGVVLYEMATGQLPFQGSTSALAFVQLLNEEPARLAGQWNAAIPRPLERVIQRLLEKDPADRYPSAVELGRALAGIGAEKRPAWFRKETSQVVLARDPVTRPKYPPRKAAAAKITTAWVDAEDFGARNGPLRARAAEVDGVRAQVQRELEERRRQAVMAVASDGGVAVRVEPEPRVSGSSAFWGTENDFWNDSPEIPLEAAAAGPRRVEGGSRWLWLWIAAAFAAGLVGGALAWSWLGAGARLL